MSTNYENNGSCNQEIHNIGNPDSALRHSKNLRSIMPTNRGQTNKNNDYEKLQSIYSLQYATNGQC